MERRVLKTWRVCKEEGQCIPAEMKGMIFA